MDNYTELLTRLKLSVSILYSKSMAYWHMGVGIVGREPQPILSDEDFAAVTKLIDRAIPKKVKRVEEIINNRVDFHQEFCDTCGTELHEYEEHKHCHECGQAIDWSEDE